MDPAARVDGAPLRTHVPPDAVVVELVTEVMRLRAEVARLRSRAWCRDATEHFGRSFIEAAGT